jgi:hypothetical protein
MLPAAAAKAGTDTVVGPTSVRVAIRFVVFEATLAKPVRVTSVAVTTVEDAIEVTAPKLTVVADIVVPEEIEVSPPRLTAPPEVILSPLAEVTPAILTAPVAVIETSPEKEAEPKENSVDPSIVIEEAV